MSQFKANEADNYGGQGGGGFFSLKNDKDTALVRFMYNTIDDFTGHAVHEVTIGEGEKKKYINCLRAYNEPVNVCPLCESGNPVRAKAFIHLYDCDEQAVKIWDRGKTFIPKLSSLCARYNPLVSVPIEIERNGKPKDTNTTYETYPLEADDVTLDDLPEVPSIIGTLVLEKTYDELVDFLETGKFAEAEPQEKTTSRRSTRTMHQPVEEAPIRRRVPASTPETARPTGRGVRPARNTNNF